MTYRIEGKSGSWEIVVGLEVHCQVISNSKLFSGASASYGGAPNTQVSFVDAAMPGMLPVLNKFCVEQAVKTSLGLEGTVNLFSAFDRKNYFYADLPQGYQISQFYHPIMENGKITINLSNGEQKDINIERLHIEQDAGKSIHDLHPTKSMIDLNRVGVCLMEIVSKPEITSPEQAGEYLKKLRSIVRYLETCDGNMNEGSMRCDVNVSVRKVDEEGLRTRAEVKNVNSVKFAMQAIEIEAIRQIEIWESGNEVVQETRLYDPIKNETRSMRSKEFAHDYRYFPDPDLLPLIISQEYVDNIKANMPEMPDAKKARFINDLNLTAYDSDQLVMEKALADYFEKVVDAKGKNRDGKQAANWVLSILLGAINKEGLTIENSHVSPEQLGDLLDLISANVISTKIAKDIFEIMLEEKGKMPSTIVEEKGLKQITDTSIIEKIVDEIIAQNPDKVQQVKDGKEKLLGWFVGQAMALSKGKANPATLNEIVRNKIIG